MNYLKITNDGLICAEDLMLIGSSTKRDQTGKIGMFGSGWKYSLAWLLRNDCKPIIMAGHNKIDIDFNVKMHRTNAVNVITVDGKETSLTTEMGPKWTGWMAVREILSNAIDEGNHSITTAWLPEFKGQDNVTTIYVPMSSELSEVMLKFDSYFAFYRKESYSNETCRMFFKTEESNLNIYRKGIRCFDTNTRSKVDFDFNDLYISEDRLTSDYYINNEIRKMVLTGLPTHILKRLIVEEKGSWLPTSINDSILQNLIDILNEGGSFTTVTLQKLGGVIFTDPNAYVIPADWFKKLQDLGLVKSPFEFLSGSEQFIRTDAKDVSGVAYHLGAMNVKMEIKSGKCESEVFVSGLKAYVKDETKLNDKDIAAHIIKRLAIDDIISFM